MENEIVTIKSLFADEKARVKFHQLMGDGATAYLHAVLYEVDASKDLSQAEPHSIYNATVLAATLGLSLNRKFGFAYLSAEKQTLKAGGVRIVAQLNISEKGFLQLAYQSKEFQTISSTPIYEGQLVSENPLTGYIFDFTKKSDKVIGYAAYFKLLYVLEKTLYMSVDELKAHATRWSNSYRNGKGYWHTDFGAACKRTVLKKILQEAPLATIKMAINADQAVINDEDATLNFTYLDAEVEVVDKELERILLMVGDAQTLQELEALRPNLKEGSLEAFEAKREELSKLKDTAAVINKEAERVELMLNDASTIEELNNLEPHLMLGQRDIFDKKKKQLLKEEKKNKQ